MYGRAPVCRRAAGACEFERCVCDAWAQAHFIYILCGLCAGLLHVVFCILFGANAQVCCVWRLCAGVLHFVFCIMFGAARRHRAPPARAAAALLLP